MPKGIYDRSKTKKKKQIKKKAVKKKVVKKKKKKTGRKWFDGKDEKVTLSKLEKVWALDGTDEEASFFANISTASLSRYLKAHPEYKEFRNRLKERPVLEARQSVVKHMKRDGGLALKYLERKKKKEFSTRQEVDDLGKNQELKALRKKMKEIL